MTRCRVGDLAVIVGVVSPAGEFLIGRFVEVLSALNYELPEGLGWEVRLQRPITNPINGLTGDTGIAADVFLRPIRPQDDSATDEMVQLLGSPAWQRAWESA